MWPGWARSLGWAFSSQNTATVRARSYADTPVVQPSMASTVSPIAVPRRAVFCLVIIGMPSCSSRSEVVGTHGMPRP